MRSFSRLLFAAALAGSSGIALAHPGALPHAHSGFVAGLLHPFTGAGLLRVATA